MRTLRVKNSLYKFKWLQRCLLGFRSIFIYKKNIPLSYSRRLWFTFYLSIYSLSVLWRILFYFFLFLYSFDQCGDLSSHTYFRMQIINKFNCDYTTELIKLYHEITFFFTKKINERMVWSMVNKYVRGKVVPSLSI